MPYIQNKKIIHLSLYQWYTISYIVIAVLRVILYLYNLISSYIYYYLRFIVRKHLKYSSRQPLLFLLSSLTRLKGIIYISFLVVNFIYISQFFNNRKGVNRTSTDFIIIYLIVVILTSTIPTFLLIFQILKSRVRLVYTHITIIILIDYIVYITLISINKGLKVNGISISSILI